MFVNVPWTGHVNPTLTLVHALVQQGYEVGYVITEEWRQKVESAGATFIPYINYLEGELSVTQKDTMCQMAAYTAALRVLDQYDLLIYEAMFFLGATLAKQCLKKSIRIFTTFAVNNHVLKLYCIHSNTWFILCLKSIRKRYTRKVVSHITLQEEDVYLEISRNKADRSIVCLAKEFQLFQEEFGDDFCFCGPMLENRNEADNGILSSIKKKKIIYISMGSILREEKILRKCIKAFANSEYEIVISLGGRKPDKYQQNAENIHVYQYVNQIEILQYASLFITHGGMNSIQEALYYNVPLMVFPINNDQFVNARRVQDLYLGRKLNRKFMTASKIHRIAKEILLSEKITNGLNRMGECIEKSRGSKACVELVRELLIE